MSCTHKCEQGRKCTCNSIEFVGEEPAMLEVELDTMAAVGLTILLVVVVLLAIIGLGAVVRWLV